MSCGRINKVCKLGTFKMGQKETVFDSEISLGM